jgi:hypothetical protein
MVTKLGSVVTVILNSCRGWRRRGWDRGKGLLTPSLGVGGKTSLGKLCNVYKNNQILVFFTHY